MSIVFNAKTKENMKKYFITQKCSFMVVNQHFFHFFSVLAFKTIDTQMLFWSVFLKTHKKTVINRQKLRKWLFWWSITFLCVFKNTDQKNIYASIVLKAESKPKHEENFFGVFFLSKTKNALFGCPKWYFLKVKFQICISAFVF